MRRRFAPLVLAALAVVSSVGCAPARGADGPQASAAAVSAAASARFVTPVAGHCYDNSGEDGQAMGAADFQDVPCTVQHDQEVVVVRAFAASVPFSPRPDSDEYRTAWQGCATAADAYLGGDWHDALDVPVLVLPNDGQWLEGVRTYVCALEGRNTPNGSGMSVSYRNGLTGARPVARTCFTFEGTAPDKDDYFTTVSTAASTACGTSHDAEYVASLQADPGTEPVPGSAQDRAARVRCAGAAATFLGRTVAEVQQKTDIEPYVYWPPAVDWARGDVSFGCYVMVPTGQAVPRSLKGIGG